MLQGRLPVRQIRDAFRLAAGDLSNRQIAAILSVSKTTVGNCLFAAAGAGLVGPRPAARIPISASSLAVLLVAV